MEKESGNKEVECLRKRPADEGCVKPCSCKESTTARKRKICAGRQEFDDAESVNSNDNPDPRVIEQMQLSRESDQSRLFRQLITEDENLGNWRLQEGPCAAGFYPPCIACSTGKAVSSNGNDCRYYNRMLRSINDPKECRRLTVGDVRRLLDHSSRSSKNIISICSSDKQNKKSTVSGKEAQIAAYILQCTKSAFFEVVAREEQAVRLTECSEENAFFSHSYNVKQICDACSFAILNAHYCCTTCGTELCFLCFSELNQRNKKPSKWLKKVPCIGKEKHKAEMFHLGSFLLGFDVYKDLQKAVGEQFNRFSIKDGGAICNGNHGRMRFQVDKCYCPRRSSMEQVHLERICIIKDQMEPEAYTKFKAHLAMHLPVVVEGVNRHPDYNPSLWSREAFEKIIASYKKLRILNGFTMHPEVMEGKPCSLDYFWQKFESKHVADEPYLKIKDFPDKKLFSEVAPEQYENLFKILPFLDYTHINAKESGKGGLNLLNVLNAVDDPPDPGPKAYLCLGMCDAPYLASTPLHLDVSNACNFLPFVQAPKEMSQDELRAALERRLSCEGVSSEEKKRALKNPEKAGALWKIFHPDDNEKLREAIADWKKEKGEKWTGDVIHNQDVVVTPEMTEFLEARGIHCNVFVQNEGEVVFVPSGAAHQVQNLNSCIKLAEDFVAAEGIKYVTDISDELRLLKKKDDLVQVDIVLYRACSMAVSILANAHPRFVSSSL